MYFTVYAITTISVALYSRYNMIGWFQQYNTTTGDLLVAIPDALTICGFDAEN
jgi:hypothetical protein